MGVNDKELDRFWDISELIPRKTYTVNRVNTSSVDVENTMHVKEKDEHTEDTVIKRYISPNITSGKLGNISYDKVFEYSPVSSLIHRVTVNKWKTQYNYYSVFLKNAIEYMEIKGSPCEYVPFFSYLPQYDQMNSKQLKYYFWFRENIRNGVYIKTDISYVFLYVFELLNLGSRLDVKKTQYTLTELWKAYADIFPSLSTKLPMWICDYSLLHRLPPPENAPGGMLRSVMSLKEFYINMPPNDIVGCAKSMLKHCTSYDYHTSKFYNKDNAYVFDNYILGAVIKTIQYYSDESEVLSKISFGDSMIERDVYAGALCAAEQKYRIRVEYCSFSTANELRFLIGDVVKYSENKLRVYLGIKSKMTVYSVSGELKKILDDYFDTALPRKSHIKAKKEKHEYDVLYDVPKKKLSLSDASKIESESWETTKELISAFEFEEEELYIQEPTKSMDVSDSGVRSLGNETFGIYTSLLSSMVKENIHALENFALEKGMMCDALVDQINEIAFDFLGDILIEERNGEYEIIEDYKYLFE